MKKIFILYSIDGKTLAIEAALKVIIAAIRELTEDDTNTLWVNQYEVGEDCLSFPANTVWEEYLKNPDIEDLSSIISS